MSQGLAEWGEKPPGEYLHRFVELVIDAYEPATERAVEMALRADGGPIETVLWAVLDGYDEHEIFVEDDQPDRGEIRKLHSWHPDKEQLPQLKAYFQQTYSSCREVEAVFTEIPDTYNPQLGRKPQVNVAAYYDSSVDRIKVTTKATPLQHQDRILEDVNKLVPADGLDAFFQEIDQKLTEEITAEYDWRVLHGDIRDQLDADPDFRQETTKPIPDGTHPDYGGEEAELWQKPASTVDYIDGSQGFLQVWLPVDEPATAVVTATSGEYDERSIVEEAREQFETSSRTIQ